MKGTLDRIPSFDALHLLWSYFLILAIAPDRRLSSGNSFITPALSGEELRWLEYWHVGDIFIMDLYRKLQPAARPRTDLGIFSAFIVCYSLSRMIAGYRLIIVSLYQHYLVRSYDGSSIHIYKRGLSRFSLKLNKKNKMYVTRASQVVSHLSTGLAHAGLTLECGKGSSDHNRYEHTC